MCAFASLCCVLWWSVALASQMANVECWPKDQQLRFFWHYPNFHFFPHVAWFFFFLIRKTTCVDYLPASLCPYLPFLVLCRQTGCHCPSRANLLLVILTLSFSGAPVLSCISVFFCPGSFKQAMTFSLLLFIYFATVCVVIHTLFRIFLSCFWSSLKTALNTFEGLPMAFRTPLE